MRGAKLVNGHVRITCVWSWFLRAAHAHSLHSTARAFVSFSKGENPGFSGFYPPGVSGRLATWVRRSTASLHYLVPCTARFFSDFFTIRNSITNFLTKLVSWDGLCSLSGVWSSAIYNASAAQEESHFYPSRTSYQALQTATIERTVTQNEKK